MSDEVQTEQQPRDDAKTRAPRKPMGRPKRKICAFCMEKGKPIDYKDIARIKKYVSEKGKIITRRTTGLCALHQREVTNAIKRARTMSLL